MPKLIIHAGAHKTGTTAIQHHLWRRQDALLEMGVLYPRTGIPGSGGTFFGHHEIPWAYLGGGGTATADLLREEIERSGAHTVVVSSEEFDRLTPVAITDLCSALPFAITVLFYYRRQSDIIEGMYRTDVIHGHERRTLEHFVASYSGALDFGAFATAWSSAPNVKSVLPRAYSPKHFPDGNVVFDFLAALSLPTSTERDEEDNFRYNQSLPWHAVSVIQKLREMLVSEQVIGRAIEAITVVSRRTPPERGALMSPAQAQAIDGQYLERNAAFHASFCPAQPAITPRAEDDLFHIQHQGLWPDVERTIEWLAEYVIRTKR
ncbi:MAG: hypothetical protein KIT43_15545 [Bauldia sp.]|nr:hypothetical protein [Bauldia sp.]